MKPVLILIRIIIVGLFWSVFFLEGIRVIMLRNWYFDIFNSEHWSVAWNLWINGWIIDEPKEWAFVLIILTFIPLWLTGWAALSLINWEKIFVKSILFPLNILKRFFIKPVVIIKNSSNRGIRKRKSYKEVRPRSLSAPLDDSVYRNSAPTQSALTDKSRPSSKSAPASLPAPSPRPLPQSPSLAQKDTPISGKSSFDHSLFKFDEDEDFEFNIDSFDEKPTAKETKDDSRDNKKDNKKPDNRDNKDNRNSDRKDNRNDRENNRGDNKNNRREPSTNAVIPDNRKNSNQPVQNNQNQNGPKKNTPQTEVAKAPRIANSTLDVIKQKGYEVISGATIKDTLIDFIAVSEKQIILCLIDKESGDWLADEERFNDEEPLWFSESSHRISPVRKADIARLAVTNKISESDFNFEVKACVIIQIGNIINAEDMFEVWDNMNISVTRIDRGSPKELRLFSKSLDDAEGSVDNAEFEKLKKFIRNIT